MSIRTWRLHVAKPLSPYAQSLRSAGDEAGLAEASSGVGGRAEQVIQELNEFRVNVRRWLEAVTLPIDQLVLTLAQDIFTEAADLALAHKLALVLRKAADDHPEWRLPELTAELAVIAKNERRFIGFSSDDSGFDPEQHTRQGGGDDDAQSQGAGVGPCVFDERQ